MQISVEQMANTRNDGFFSSLSASNMNSEPISMGLPLAGGGVWGSVKLYTPSAMLEAAAIQKMFNDADHPAMPSARPATIQPIVPQTRAFGNNSCGRCVKVIVLPRPRVGM